jgi:AraC family transcriptional regulator of adaptative response/methylated-DNA-[protein]-cysteine methyltransferase
MEGAMKILVDTFPTPLGDMMAAWAPDGLALLEFTDRFTAERNQKVLRKRFVNCELVASPLPVLRAQMDAYFRGHDFDVPLCAGGTPFQRRVWSALRAIPRGATRSYQEVAASLGQPTAVRAVARANGQNPLSIVVPCHRVIGADGSLTGYGGGLWRKDWLLKHEKAIQS